MRVRGVILGVKCRRHLGISVPPLPNATLVVAILSKFSSILIMTLVLGDLGLFCWFRDYLKVVSVVL